MTQGGNPTQRLFNDSSLESIRLNDEYDFHYYKAPKTFNKKKIKETLKWVLTPSTEKFKQGFLYPVESKAKLLPATDSYENLPEVKSTRRFKIYMKAKKTLAQEILEKRDKTPGPGQYKTEQIVKIKGHYSNKLQRNAYIEEIEYLAKQCPGPNFYILIKTKFNFTLKRENTIFLCSFDFNNFYNLNYNSQDRRSISPNIKRDTTEKDTKLIRNNSPSPHTYSPEVVKDKFQIKLNKGSQQWAKAKDVKFIDQLIKQKKQIPGVGQYENLASSLDYQSKLCTQLIHKIAQEKNNFLQNEQLNFHNQLCSQNLLKLIQSTESQIQERNLIDKLFYLVQKLQRIKQNQHPLNNLIFSNNNTYNILFQIVQNENY